LRLLYLLISVAWAGCFYGFDSGNIGGILTLPSFENAFGLTGLDQVQIDNRKVSSLVFSSILLIVDYRRVQSLPCWLLEALLEHSALPLRLIISVVNGTKLIKTLPLS
jgi:hypothetical protein